MKKNILIFIGILVIIGGVYLGFKYTLYKSALIKPATGIPAADCGRFTAEKGFIYFLQKSNLCDIMN